MYIRKLTPQESLEAIKLRMNYDSSKTLNENKSQIFEQLTTNQRAALDQGYGPVTPKAADELVRQGKVKITSNTLSAALNPNTAQNQTVAAQEPFLPFIKPPALSPSTGSVTNLLPLAQKPTADKPKPTTQIAIPKQLKDVKGVQDFQNWLDQNYPKWHEKYGILNQSVSKGFGKFGPRTNKWWKSVGKDYLNIRNTKDRKHAERIVLSDGNTLVWDGRDKKWMSDQDFLKIYNNDGSFRVSLPQTQINRPQDAPSVANVRVSATPSIQPVSPTIVRKATKDVGF